MPTPAKLQAVQAYDWAPIRYGFDQLDDAIDSANSLPVTFQASVFANAEPESDRLFVMRPHPKYANRPLFHEYFIHDSVLNIDASGVSAGEISDKLLARRRILKRVGIQHI